MTATAVVSVIVLARYKEAIKSSSFWIIHSLKPSTIIIHTFPQHLELHRSDFTAIMQFSTIITALFLASTAVACPNGPYRTGSSCDQTCAGAQRCGDDNYVVSPPRLYSAIFSLVSVFPDASG